MLKTICAAIIVCLVNCAQAQNFNLKINEIIASNDNGTMDDFFEYDDWVEIFNPPGSGITNLAGYYLSDDIADLTKWQIPAVDAGVTTVLPNNFIVFWIDDDYNNMNSQGADHNAGFTLSSEGETFILTAPDGTSIIDSVTYPLMAPDISWGRTCDGCATWQYFNNVTFDDNNFEQQPLEYLYINEVQTINTSTYDDPQHEFDQWFEIYNPNSVQVNLANYYIGIDGNPLQWHVPSNNPYRSVIPAGGFLLIWCDNDLADDLNHAPFTLNTSGGTITLTAPDGSTSIDAYTYGALASDVSYGRQNDGSATSILFTIPTPSVSNALFIIQPQNVVINEILPANQTDTIDNAGDNSDWFEIYNPNNFPVNLGGYYCSDDPEVRNKWKIPTDFPDSVTVPANGWLIFWADADENQGVRHAAFRLSNLGEYLSISSPDGFTLADELEWGFIAPDTSYGRITDGADTWILFTGTTPEYSNGSGTVDIQESELTPLQVFPNPAHDVVRFNTQMNIQVYSITGAVIESYSKVTSLNISHYPSGYYLLKNDEGQIVRLLKN
jgi:hypothetical protein